MTNPTKNNELANEFKKKLLKLGNLCAKTESVINSLIKPDDLGLIEIQNKELLEKTFEEVQGMSLNSTLLMGAFIGESKFSVAEVYDTHELHREKLDSLFDELEKKTDGVEAKLVKKLITFCVELDGAFYELCLLLKKISDEFKKTTKA